MPSTPRRRGGWIEDDVSGKLTGANARKLVSSKKLKGASRSARSWLGEVPLVEGTGTSGATGGSEAATSSESSTEPSRC